jgi:hypothetical protein
MFDLEKYIKKYKSKLDIITANFYLEDQQISKKERFAYPQMVESIKKITDSIIIIFSPINLPSLHNISSNK